MKPSRLSTFQTHLMTKGNNFSFSAAPRGIKLLDSISQVGINLQGCIKALLQLAALVFPERMCACVFSGVCASTPA